MPKTIIVTGYLIQHSWENFPVFSQEPREDAFSFTHRAVEVEVTVASLRIDPTDTAARERIIQANTIKGLEKDKAKKCLEIEVINEQIQSLLCIEHQPKTPVAQHCQSAPTPQEPVIDFDDDILF